MAYLNTVYYKKALFIDTNKYPKKASLPTVSSANFNQTLDQIMTDVYSYFPARRSRMSKRHLRRNYYDDSRRPYEYDENDSDNVESRPLFSVRHRASVKDKRDSKRYKRNYMYIYQNKHKR